MTQATRLPGAIQLQNGFDYGNMIATPQQMRIVLHTTETMGLPGYNDGRSAPHLTWNPVDGATHQHLDFGRKAGALRRPSQAWETNGLVVCQIECRCYSDKATADASPSRLWAGDLTDLQLLDLAGIVKWVADEWGVPLTYNPPPFHDSRCYGTGSACRMLVDEWLLTSGVMGHNVVPGNTHWDPDGLPVARVVELAGGSIVTPGDDDMFCAKGQVGPKVEYWQMHMNRINVPSESGLPDLTVDGDYGPKTAAMVAMHTDLDGDVIGPAQMDELEQRLRQRTTNLKMDRHVERFKHERRT